MYPSAASMKLVLQVVSLLLIATGIDIVDSKPLDFGPKIFGGDDTEPGEYPYFVEMEQCGGVLVAPDIVLSAAHCSDLTNQQVNIGSHQRRSSSGGAQQRYCDAWIPHPEYNTGPGTLDNDFALCKLDRPVDDTTRFAELNGDGSVPVTDRDLLAMGYGYVNVNNEFAVILQDVTVLSIADGDCENSWNIPDNARFVPEIQTCAGYLGVGERDACVGDSGGPLISRTFHNNGGEHTDTVVGLVSYGTLPCGQGAYPTVYSRVSSAYDWIRTEMCTTLQSVSPLCGGGEQPPPSPPDQYTPRQCEANEIEMVVRMKTDPYNIASSALRSNYWTLHEGTESDPIVKYRRYFLTDYESEPYKLCLKENTFYTWRLIDRQYNGMCTNGVCGSYKVTLDGETIVEGNGDDFINRVMQSFTTTTAPTSSSSTSFPTRAPSTSAPTKTKLTKKPKRTKYGKRNKR